jgi:hypothetical protein
MEGKIYDFTVCKKDGSELAGDFVIPERLGEVAYIHFYAKKGILPPYLFFFTEGEAKLLKFFGKAFFQSGGAKAYYYCVYTDKYRIFVDAFNADDLTYVIKPDF